jgi:hypothetical protein
MKRKSVAQHPNERLYVGALIGEVEEGRTRSPMSLSTLVDVLEEFLQVVDPHCCRS